MVMLVCTQKIHMTTMMIIQVVPGKITITARAATMAKQKRVYLKFCLCHLKKIWGS